MATSRPLVAVIIFCLTGCYSLGQSDARSARDSLLDGILTRSELIFSGRIVYRLTAGFPEDKRKQTQECVVTFHGSSWRLDQSIPVSEMFIKTGNKAGKPPPLDSLLKGRFQSTRLSHRGKSLTYKATPQLDGEVRHSAVVSGEEPISRRLGGPPIFAGTFWFACTRDFVQAGQQQGVSRASRPLGGEAVTLLEWQVNKENLYKAFHATDELTKDGGTLRVYAASQLGYALPLVEYVGAKGTVMARFEGRGFKEVGKGIYFPSHLSMQYFDAKDPGYRVDYEILDVKSLNEPISDSEFAVELPDGTHAYDARDGRHSTYYRVSKDGPFPTDLDEIVVIPRTWIFRRGWITALALGVAAGSVSLLLAWYFRRRRARRAIG